MVNMSTMSGALRFFCASLKRADARRRIAWRRSIPCSPAPGKDRASPDEAMLFLADVRERLTLVALDEEEYTRVLLAGAAAGITGEGIYDAIVGGCAMKAKAEAIYTWNVKHFVRLGGDIAPRVTTP